MRAAYIEALGGPEQIRYGDLPDPVPTGGQVLVQVRAVAVNSVDTYLRSGAWRSEIHFPLAVGRDLVGIVQATGPGVDDWKPGDAVWTNSAGYGGRPGATAELVAVQDERLYPLPAGADPVSFVAAVHPGATAYGALVERAHLQPTDSVAIVGATGSVGMCMVQLAAAHAREVLAVVRNPGAADRLHALGATQVVIADAQDAPSAAAAAASSGVDVFVDASGRAEVGAAAAKLNPRGRVVLIAGRRREELDLWQLYVRETQLLGFIMSGMTAGELADAAHWINGTYPRRPLVVSVGRTLRFDAAAQAHETLESGELPRMSDGTVGRLVLTP